MPETQWIIKDISLIKEEGTLKFKIRWVSRMEVLQCITIWQKDKQVDVEERKHMDSLVSCQWLIKSLEKKSKHLLLRELDQYLQKGMTF